MAEFLYLKAHFAYIHQHVHLLILFGYVFFSESVKSKEGSDSSGIGSPVHRARTDARHRSNSPSAQGRKGSPSNRSRTRSPAHHLRTDSPPNKLKVNSELARSVDSLNGPG